MKTNRFSFVVNFVGIALIPNTCQPCLEKIKHAIKYLVELAPDTF